jgi:hypothetical protein
MADSGRVSALSRWRRALRGRKRSVGVPHHHHALLPIERLKLLEERTTAHLPEVPAVERKRESKEGQNWGTWGGPSVIRVLVSTCQLWLRDFSNFKLDRSSPGMIDRIGHRSVTTTKFSII